MHIKQITISNFRSFRQQGQTQPFSSGTNTIVGRNGTGKSNLFDAVQFCLLAPRFAHLRQEERQALLHEGSGAAAVNAFVEIVFDNSDHRFQHENSDEVVLRRTIGLKKDEFFLQRKRTTKAEIQSLLEGAGFSKSNPYFIVQQGKVQDLCTMSDSARLNLLKEVAGTTVYDEKKSESLAKMEENKNSISKITEMLENIEERLQELNAEKDELDTYQKYDRSRRAAQYSLYTLELQKARSTLDSIEQERLQHHEKASELHEQSRAIHDKIRNTEATLKQKSNQLRRIRTHVQNMEADKSAALEHFTKLDLEIHELEESMKSYQEQAHSNRKKLVELEKEITSVQTKLETDVQPAFETATKKLQGLQDQRDAAHKEAEALYAKQGRGRMFETIEERDAFLQSNKQELELQKNEKTTELADQRDTLANLRRTVDKTTADIQKLQSDIISKEATKQSLAKTIDEKGRQKVLLTEKRQSELRKNDELSEQVRDARNDLQACVSDTKKIMPRATAMGLEALKSIVEAEGLIKGEQYFGMLMDSFSLKDSKYQTAVEAAAQNSLFHVIVDNDTTAAKLMEHLEKKKLGRVTFLPLSQLRVESVQYPESSEVRPMLDLCLEYDEKVDLAMRHVFAKKLIAKSVQVGSEWNIKLSMDVITLEGDLCSRKGAMTGGYVDVNRSRLRAYSKQIAAQEKLSKIQREYEDTKRGIDQVANEAQNLLQELQRLEAKQAQLNRLLTTKETELERAESRVSNQRKQIEDIEKLKIPPLERSIAALEKDMKLLDEEMGTELQQTLSSDDRVRLSELKELQETLSKEIESQEEKLDAVSLEKQKLTSLLENNLFQRRRELVEGGNDNNEGERRRSRGRSNAEDQAQRQQELEERRRELENAERMKQDAEARLEEARQNEADIRKEIHAAKNELVELRGQDLKYGKEWDEAREKSERFMTKRNTFMQKRESNTRKIQELGSLPPPSELKKFEGKSVSQLEKALDRINKELKKYSHVNKKAYDQYVNFSDSRVSLNKRKEELDQGAQKVQELIDSLDKKKDEAINRTFRGVSQHFRTVFKELVPDGAGELIMRTAIDAETENPDDDDESSSDEGSTESAKQNDKQNPDVSLFRGIGIKVRFSAVGENFMMSQLSGGQKALVALALIFAIQRCDPAPFYLFDELDQALDSTYRAAVANVIQRQANDKENPTQFIVSTFRQELVSVANRCYGISHQNKVSNLHYMNKKDAQVFIANLLNEEEAVGEVTSLATSKVSRLSRGSRKRSSAGKESENATPKSGKKSRKKAVVDDDLSDDGPSDIDSEKYTPPKSGKKSRKKSVAKPLSDDDLSDIDSEKDTPPKSGKKSRKKGVAKPADDLSDDGLSLDSDE